MKLSLIVNLVLSSISIFAYSIQKRDEERKNLYLVCQPYNYLCKLKQINKCRNEGIKYLKSYHPEKGNEIYKSCVEILTNNGQPQNYTLKTNIKTFGRSYYLDDNTLWFSLTNTGFEYKFWGTSTNITIAADSGSCSTDNPARVMIYKDNLYYDEILTKKKKNTIKINFDESGEHVVRLLKASESYQGSLRLQEIQTDSGIFEPTPELDKKIEFIGDSIVCGFGVDGKSAESPFTTKTEDGTKAYPYKVARKFNADFSMVSYSGYGIISGYTNDGTRIIDERVSLYYDKVGRTKNYEFKDDNYNLKLNDIQWDPNEFIPDLIVINLGTNDISYINSITDDDLRNEAMELFITEYAIFLQQIRSTHPYAQILCTLGIMGNDLFPQIKEAVKRYVAETNDKNVNTFEFKRQDTVKNGAGAQWHPSALSHIDAANELIDEIERIYKWTPDPNVDITNQ